MAFNLTIRSEQQQDIDAIASVIKAAFSGMPYAEGDEAELVAALRSDHALPVSLVAEIDGVIVGQICFSPAQAIGFTQKWFALGPLAVAPDYQRKGIGSILVYAGLFAIRDLGAKGCILVGDSMFYSRFGFFNAPLNAPCNQPSEHFMIKILASDLPVGTIAFHKAFDPAPKITPSCPHDPLLLKLFLME